MYEVVLVLVGTFSDILCPERHVYIIATEAL